MPRQNARQLFDGHAVDAGGAFVALDRSHGRFDILTVTDRLRQAISHVALSGVAIAMQENARPVPNKSTAGPPGTAAPGRVEVAFVSVSGRREWAMAGHA
jgi:hypothetical protein